VAIFVALGSLRPDRGVEDIDALFRLAEAFVVVGPRVGQAIDEEA